MENTVEMQKVQERETTAIGAHDDTSKDLRQKILYLFAFIFVQSICMFGLVFVAIYMSKDSEAHGSGVVTVRETGNIVKTQKMQPRLDVEPNSKSTGSRLYDGSPSSYVFSCEKAAASIEDCAKDKVCDQEMACISPGCTKIQSFSITMMDNIPLACSSLSYSSKDCENAVCSSTGDEFGWNMKSVAGDGVGICVKGQCTIDVSDGNKVIKNMRHLEACSLQDNVNLGHMPHAELLTSSNIQDSGLFTRMSKGASYRCPNALTSFWSLETKRALKIWEDCHHDRDSTTRDDTERNQRECVANAQLNKCECAKNWRQLIVEKKRRGTVIQLFEVSDEGSSEESSFARIVDEDLGMLLYCKKAGPSDMFTLTVDKLDHPSDMFNTVVQFTDSYPNVFGSKNDLNIGKISSTKVQWSATGTDVQDYRFCFAEKATCAFIDVDEKEGKTVQRILKRTCR